MFGLNLRSQAISSWTRSRPSSRSVRCRDRRFRPTVRLQPLEARIALSHATVQVGAVQPGQNSAFSGAVARRATKDYQFEVNSRTIVAVTLSGLSSNAELVLLDANKTPLASFSNGKANDSFTYTFSPGTYYAQVVGLGKRKAHYQLDVTATALPTPASTPSTTPPTPSSPSATTPGRSPSSTPTTSPSSTPTTSPSSTSTTSPSSTPATPQGPTFQDFVSALNTVTTAAVKQFVLDAAAIEGSQKTQTLLSGRVDLSLIALAIDVKNGNNFQAFADFQTLGNTLFAEASQMVAYGYAPQAALLSNAQIVSDLTKVAALKEVTFALLDFIASHTSYHSTGSTSAVWNTALFAQGNAGGILSPTAAMELTEYSVPSINYMNNYFTSIDNSIDSYQTFDEEADSLDDVDIADPLNDDDFDDIGEDGLGTFGDDDLS
jgi:Bacterial pre-peptidase C-terminal domain